MEDTPKTLKRRNREKRTISQMVAIYCKGHHSAPSRARRAYCGEMVCPACLELDSYAVARTQNCRNMGTKATCEECPNHCYEPSMREAIRQAMRFAGPRMVTAHPIAAIRHLLAL